MYNYFKYSEFFVNQSPQATYFALQNIEYSKNLNLLFNYMNKLRHRFGCAIRITSGYRTPVHNKQVGGSDTSQHMNCSAVDITITSRCKYTIHHLLALIRDIELSSPDSERVLGQVILYPSKNFIHIALQTSSHPSYEEYIKSGDKLIKQLTLK